MSWQLGTEKKEQVLPLVHQSTPENCAYSLYSSALLYTDKKVCYENHLENAKTVRKRESADEAGRKEIFRILSFLYFDALTLVAVIKFT